MAGWFIGWRMRCCFRLEKVNIGLLPSWTLLLAPWRAHLWTLWFESHLLQFFFLFTRHCSHSVLVFDWAGSLVWFACQAWTFDPQQGWLVFPHISFSMRAGFNSFTMSESFRVTVELCPKQWQTERPPAVKTSRAGCEQFDVASLISPWTRLPHRLNLSLCWTLCLMMTIHTPLPPSLYLLCTTTSHLGLAWQTLGWIQLQRPCTLTHWHSWLALVY